MYCSKCGKELKEGVKFCGVCGTPIPENAAVQAEEPIQAPVVEAPVQAPVVEAPVQAPVVEVAPKTKAKMPTGIKVLISVVAAIVVLGGIFLTLYFCTDLFKEPTLCQICEAEIEKDEEYCEDCIDEYTCKECEEVDEDIKDGLCPDCLEKLVFCKECEEVIEKGFYCDDCIAEIGNDEVYCFLCDADLKNEEIFIIDRDGFYYCEDCDTGNYCENCGSIIEKDDDDTVCFWCADVKCNACEEVLDESEVAHTNDSGYSYCEECFAAGAHEQSPCWLCGSTENLYYQYSDGDWECYDCFNE